RLEPGTGREAAAALARPLAQMRPWSTSHRPLSEPWGASAAPQETLTINLFSLFRPRRWLVRNQSGVSLPSSKGGFLGPEGTQELLPGAWVGPGLLEIEAVGTNLRRRVNGLIRCQENRTLTVTLTAQEYAAGVIAAEVPGATEARRLELGAAVLRFLAQGPRHGGVDVCDSTHCAWFIGRGPRVEWVSATFSTPRPSEQEPPILPIPDSEWKAMQALARHPGPSQWSSHCGGNPLSPHALWGNGNHAIHPCSRHTGTSSHPWQRIWKTTDLAKAFGAPVTALSVKITDGLWTLSITGPQGTRTLRYDDAHRRLATVLGWDALPSPADDISEVPGGFRVTGVGFGHRVGLCLGE
ncbi:MAG: SpoIID/LytB domain-containing protein, partial [Holophaga sp.]|nr:SpoIID/LytB domain-containing protein [Holophaga sp.]